MGLKIELTTEQGLTFESAYLKLAPGENDSYRKEGRLLIYIWPDYSYRNDYRPIDEISIPIISEEKFSPLGDGDILTLNSDDIIDKTRSELYTFLKTKKYRYASQILDFSTAIDQ